MWRDIANKVGVLVIQSFGIQIAILIHIPFSGFNASLSPLSPYATYVCKVILYNVAGPSEPVVDADMHTTTYCKTYIIYICIYEVHM